MKIASRKLGRDNMQGSIRERILKNGRDCNGKMRSDIKVYDVCYRFVDASTGKHRQTTKRGFRRKKDAEAYLLDINSKQFAGLFVEQKTLLIRDFLLEWLEDYVKINVRATSYEEYKRIIDSHLIPHFGSMDIKNLQPIHIDKFYAWLLSHGRADGKGGLAPRSVLYTHRVFHEALNYAVGKRLISYDPMKGVTNVPHPKKYKASVYSPTELLAALSVAKGSVWESAIALAGICGLRRGECLGLRISDINLENKTICICRQAVEVKLEIVFSEPKSDESNRMIHIPDEVSKIIQRRIDYLQNCKNMLQSEYQDHGLLICKNDGCPIRPRNFTHRFQDFLVKKGLRKIRFHDLRHSAASLMAKSGVEMKTVSSILGHSTIMITADLYTHVFEDTKKIAAEQVEQELFGEGNKFANKVQRKMSQE